MKNFRKSQVGSSGLFYCQLFQFRLCYEYVHDYRFDQPRQGGGCLHQELGDDESFMRLMSATTARLTSNIN
jgi:hypothetical protein